MNMVFQSNLPCMQWMKGNCPRTDVTCMYRHTKEHMPLCHAWTKGECIGGRGNDCRNRHYYKEMDERTHQPEQQESSGSCTGVLSDFNSPLVVKIRKITEKRRREEVDIETGQRRSFTETFEQEIVDITGKENTPELPKTKARRVISPLIKTAMKNVQNKKQDDKRAETENDSVILIDEDTNTSVSLPADISNVSKTPLPDDNSNLELSQMNESVVVGAGYCIQCKRTFKGQRGLKIHLNASKNRACKLANADAAKNNSTISKEMSSLDRDATIDSSLIQID